MASWWCLAYASTRWHLRWERRGLALCVLVAAVWDALAVVGLWRMAGPR